MFAQSLSSPNIQQRGKKFKEIKCGLFNDKPLRSVLLLSTNAYVKNNGKAVMSQGCALAAKERFKGIDANLGRALEIQGRKRGNYGMFKTEAVGNYPAIIWKKPGEPIIVSCPSQWHFVEKSDLSLIERSLGIIVNMADYYKWNNIYLPALGTGAGRRNWKDEIKPILMDYLDERFTVCHLIDSELW